MASLESTGSPPSRGTIAGHFIIHEEEEGNPSTAGAAQQLDLTRTVSTGGSTPLTSSKLGNIQAKPALDIGGKKPVEPRSSDLGKDLVSQLRSDHPSETNKVEQQAYQLKQIKPVSPSSDEENHQPEESTSTGSSNPTPGSAVNSYLNSSLKTDPKARAEAAEVARLQRELTQARNQIARQANQLTQDRLTKQMAAHSFAASSDGTPSPVAPQRDYAHMPQHPWSPNEEHQPHVSGLNAQSSIWSMPSRAGFNTNLQPEPWGMPNGRGFDHRGGADMNSMMMPPEQQAQQRNYSVPLPQVGRGISRGLQEPHAFGQGRGFGFPPFGPRGTGYNMLNQPSATGMGFSNMNSGPAYQGLANNQGYQPQPIGTPLPTGTTNFNGPQDQSNANPWNAGPPTSPEQTYVTPLEPLNYRRLLDRSVNCNWRYIVDKIVCNNDQQASIFLQQKLKIGTVEQKFDIIEAIVAQAYPLMINRFGNFLIQRCFEHGTPEQVISIANAIRGNTLALSMDPFGCHVVQKAFDSVPEEYKAIMVHELLRRIPETVIHRYACHVWQKLFELRWADSPPQIMKYVNEALRGMWHEVALGETGSLVVQNIFENCLEEDKRPCINEVLHNIDIVAHGQFGNWCIQHICEHGAPADRSRAIEHILRYATEYSVDQFASKVVEKCLKIGGADFLGRYLERVCEGRPDRPRMPLIDIASDQYGNYLIQWILMHTDTNHRDVVASQIRKHMVSLRGSKFGSRVAMLCSLPAYGHPTNVPPPGNNRFSSAPPGARFGSAFR